MRNPGKTNGIAFSAVIAVCVLCEGLGRAEVRQSERYRILAEVFTQGSGPAFLESDSYRASISVGQRSIIATPTDGGPYTLFPGYQAAAGNALPPGDEYMNWAIEAGLPEGRRGQDEDYDGDRFTNWEEYVADTDPTLEDSRFFVVSATRNENGIDLSFYSSSQRLYELWFTTDLLNEAGWTRVEGPRSGKDAPDSFLHNDPESPPTGFYQVRVLLPPP